MSIDTTHTSGMPSGAVNQTVRHDPQFRPPRYPLLCRGLHIVDTPDGVLIDGAAERQHLRGASAKAVRTRLFPLLDGARDAPALARETQWPVDTVEEVLSTLYFAGLLEDAGIEVEAPVPGPSPEAATWMSRTLDCSRAYPHSTFMARAAATAKVRHLLRPGWEDPLRTALRDLGLTDVERLEPAGPVDGDAVIVLDLSAPRDVLDRILIRCVEQDSRVLLFGTREARIEIGPFVDPSATACARCADAAVGPQPADPARWDSPGGEADAEDGPTVGARGLIAIGLLAEELRAVLLRNEPAHSLGGQLVLDPSTGETEVRKLTPEPTCTRCHPSADGSTPPADAEPLHYEYAVGFPPRRLVNPKSHQHHFRPENVQLQFEQLRYPNNPRIPLPDVPLSTLSETGTTARPAPWPEAIATALRYTVGIRTEQDALPRTQGERVQRWAPTGGNLGSPHAHLLARGVPGIPDGIHYYDAAAHALTTMHPHTGHLDTISASLLPPPRDGVPEVHLVLTAELARVARKYGPFSYRVGNLDAGCALAQLSIAARRTGLDCRLLDPTPWHPYRERVVGVSGPSLITAVVRLTRDGSASCL
ncbi:TOMM precursor leader peptide-binding protein [Streptomyces sp. ZAF1911]|uniref:TOMM precursor leader peptide-binding protein n=1 Tax=Streptomyces sp. ZAF1911 TaxID=2944129 RepID=UPI00237AB51E|nr:TOMM precursor leader peptide-binding protein [Streptomyces sp. ZAF1911]MDD9375791.1 TOMM precursor leader peptide-binding protein [Streptomyces sp. ZAF1911]